MLTPTDKRPAGFGISRTNPWLVFLLPFVVFMLVQSLEPGRPNDDGSKPAAWIDLGIEYRHYPLIYTAKILLTIAAMIYVYPGYRGFTNWMSPQGPNSEPSAGWPGLDRREAPVAGSGLAIFVGIIGVMAWIALAWAQHAIYLRLGWTHALGERSAFNPLEKLKSQPAWAYGFLAIRFVGLVLIVPVIEEFFLRGFLMRFVVTQDWWTVPLGAVTRLSLIVGTALPVLMHPGEALAAAVWFSAVTWLMLRTRNLWHCVLAHAITNLLLGIFVVASGNWWLM